jgi:hypothetical protein
LRDTAIGNDVILLSDIAFLMGCEQRHAQRAKSISITETGLSIELGQPHTSGQRESIPSWCSRSSRLEAIAIVWLPEDAEEGNGEKSLQGACDRRAEESILGSSLSIRAPVNRRLVYLLGLFWAK